MPKSEEVKADSKAITLTEVTLKVKDKATAESLKVFDSKKWTESKKEIKFTKKTSPADQSWRLIHDGVQVLMLFESDGETHTAQEMFVGSIEECEKEIDRLKLKRK